MSDIYENFKKDIITSCPIISSIFGAGCDVQGSNIVINDFVNHTSTPTCDLTLYQVLEIHRQNKKNSLRFNDSPRCKRRLSFEHQKDNFRDRCPQGTSYGEHVNDLACEELYDIYGIFGDGVNRKWRDFKEQSVFLYTYLTAVLGTEKIFHLRTGFVDFIKYCVNSNRISVAAIGSKAEGFDLQWSDTDYIYYGHDNVLLEHDLIKSDDTWITYDSLSEDVYPGYALIKHEDGTYILNSEIHSAMSEAKNLLLTTMHGPALQMSTAEQDIDLVQSFKSITWPRIATEWLKRKRRYGWPSDEMIGNITQKGCHIVSVSSDREHKQAWEWRLSFCEAEKQLIWTFNHTQLMIYGLLKILFKEYLSKRISNDPELLCSYFVKTTMLWVIEETPRKLWIPENSIYCYHLCLKRLIHFFVENNCPNYFVPMNNMFLKRFKENEREYILRLLCDILSNGLLWTTETELMNTLCTGFCDLKKQRKRLIRTCQLNENIEKYFIFKKILPTCAICLFSNFNGARRFLKSQLLSIRLAPHLCHFINIQNSSIRNKIVYILKRLIIRLLTLNKRDKHSYALLASYLLNESMYEASLTATDLASMETSIEKYCEVSYETTEALENLWIFSKYRKEVQLLNGLLICPLDTHLITYFKMFSSQLTTMKDYCPCYALPFNMYILLLQFVCYHNLGLIRQRDEAYTKMNHLEYERDDLLLQKVSMKLFCCLVKKNMKFENILNEITYSPDALLNMMSTLDITLSELMLMLRTSNDLMSTNRVNVSSMQDISGVNRETVSQLVTSIMQRFGML